MICGNFTLGRLFDFTFAFSLFFYLKNLWKKFFKLITSNFSITSVTTITTMPKGMKVKFSRNFEGEGELNHNAPSVCRLSKRCNRNILGTVWCVNLKLTGLVVTDVKLTKRKYYHSILLHLLILLLLLLLLLLLTLPLKHRLLIITLLLLLLVIHILPL